MASHQGPAEARMIPFAEKEEASAPMSAAKSASRLVFGLTM